MRGWSRVEGRGAGGVLCLKGPGPLPWGSCPPSWRTLLGPFKQSTPPAPLPSAPLLGLGRGDRALGERILGGRILGERVFGERKAGERLSRPLSFGFAFLFILTSGFGAGCSRPQTLPESTPAVETSGSAFSDSCSSSSSSSGSGSSFRSGSRDDAMTSMACTRLLPLVDPSRSPRSRYVGMIAVLITPAGERVLGLGETIRGSGVRPDARTVYELGSLTKLFTALLLADASIRGRVSIDGPIADCAPSQSNALCFEGRAIRFGELASHTSGLPRLPTNWKPSNPHNPWADYTEAKLAAFLAEFRLTRAPATQYEYSNLATGYLGYRLAQRERMPYSRLLRERILDPLGMNDSAIELSPDQRSRLPQGYDWKGRATPPWDRDDRAVLAGSGALRSSGADVAKFLRVALGLRSHPLLAAIRKTLEPRFKINEKRAVGLAWELRPLKGRAWKNGATGGFSSSLWIDPLHQVGVALLSNSSLDGDAADELDQAASDILTGLLRSGKPQAP